MTIVINVVSVTRLENPNDNSMLDMLIGYSCIKIRIFSLLLLSLNIKANIIEIQKEGGK